MLPKKYRLKNNSAFKATFRVKNSKYKNGISVFFGKPKTDDQDIKIGFIVSKKTHKRAVKRNKIRRLMRESIRLILKNNYQFENLSLILIGHEKALGQNFVEIDTTIKELLGIKK